MLAGINFTPGKGPTYQGKSISPLDLKRLLAKGSNAYRPVQPKPKKAPSKIKKTQSKTELPLPKTAPTPSPQQSKQKLDKAYQGDFSGPRRGKRNLRTLSNQPRQVTTDEQWDELRTQYGPDVVDNLHTSFPQIGRSTAPPFTSPPGVQFAGSWRGGGTPTGETIPALAGISNVRNAGYLSIPGDAQGNAFGQQYSLEQQANIAEALQYRHATPTAAEWAMLESGELTSADFRVGTNRQIMGNPGGLPGGIDTWDYADVVRWLEQHPEGINRYGLSGVGMSRVGVGGDTGAVGVGSSSGAGGGHMGGGGGRMVNQPKTSGPVYGPYVPTRGDPTGARGGGGGYGGGTTVASPGGTPFCWVAGELYGWFTPKWRAARRFLIDVWTGPERDTFVQNYMKHGPEWAELIRTDPEMRAKAQVFFDMAVEGGW